MNHYVTPYMLWADKTGRLPDKSDNEAMRQGRDLEQYVADRFMEAMGKKVRRRTSMFHNPVYPFAHANIDRAVVGERAGIECKTTSLMNLKKFKNGEYPENFPPPVDGLPPTDETLKQNFPGGGAQDAH